MLPFFAYQITTSELITGETCPMTFTLSECIEIIYNVFSSLISNFSSQFSLHDIILTTDIAQSVKDFGMEEDATGYRGVTFQLDTGEIKVIVVATSNPFDFAEAVYHELIHVCDFIRFKNIYNVSLLKEHPLYNTLNSYTEYNAHKLGTLLATVFIRGGWGIDLANKYVSVEAFKDNIKKTKDGKHLTTELFRYLGQASLLDEHFQCEDYSKAVFNLMPNQRCSDLLHEIYEQCQLYPPQLEYIDILVDELCACS